MVAAHGGDARSRDCPADRVRRRGRGGGGSHAAAAAAGPRLVQLAGARTGGARGATMFLSVEASGTPNGSGRVDGFGAVDLPGGRADLTFDLSGLAPDAPRRLPVRVIGAKSYLDFTGQPLPSGITLPAGKTWVSVDSTSAPTLDTLTPFGDVTTHPARAMQALRGVGASVHSIGAEKIRGVATTRYRGDVSLVDIVRPAPGTMPAAQQATIRTQLAKLEGTRVPTDVWVDADGRARRIQVTITAADFTPVDPSAAGDHTIVTTTMEFSDFGRRVNIVPPPVGTTVSVNDVPHLGDALGVNGSGANATPTGPWTTVQAGSTGGVDWVLLEAAASDGTSVCIGLDVGTRVPSGQPGDFDCLDRNTADDPITVYGSNVTGSRTYVFGGTVPEADRLTITSKTGARVDTVPRGGTFVAFLTGDDQVAHIEAFSGSRSLGTCVDTTNTTTAGSSASGC